ncbi:hypothetical protein [Vibrio sp. LaRot3]|uniref:hypothetical protein n=1 Tax=Vibrio sp. LaRot3 TaxID=2998829 RepID=UPI0022CDF3D6|nr:hypothetical protein [Vibrio sp. LaRot3]MDA0147037.1 hypothetical protein [Vibrio sp. LaRot3]
MKATTLLVMVIASLSMYFVYNHYVVQPKQLNAASENMLTQMAIKERWFDPFGLLSATSRDSINLSTEVDSAFRDGENVYANGKITYISETAQICKIVDFRLQAGSLNDYEIFTQSDCAL